jgi:glycerophosphoryl diester phosphodiesterase
MNPPLFARPIAHRGLHDRAAGICENSRSAFAAAMAGNFSIECDVQLSADGTAVVFHDERLERLTGHSGLVHDHKASDITAMPLLGSASGDRPQTLAEFLAQISGRVQLQIELKQQADDEASSTLAGAVAGALADYKGPATVESFDPALIILVRDLGFSGPRGIITHGYAEESTTLSEDRRFILRHLLHWQETRFDFISCGRDAVTLPAISFWRTLGMPVTAWTIRSAVEAEAVRDHIDQIVFEGFNPDLGQ